MKTPILEMEFKPSMLTMDLKKGITKYLKTRQKEIKRKIFNKKQDIKTFTKELDLISKFKIKMPSDTNRMKDLEWAIKDRLESINKINEDGKMWSSASLYKDIRKVSKNPHIIGIEMDTEGFIVYTQRLVVRNKQIGSYTIHIPYEGNEIKIYNKNKDSDEYQHWFVDIDGTPCFEDWEDGIFKSLRIGDLGMVILDIIQFLLSTYKAYDGHLNFNEFYIEENY